MRGPMLLILVTSALLAGCGRANLLAAPAGAPVGPLRMAGETLGSSYGMAARMAPQGAQPARPALAPVRPVAATPAPSPTPRHAATARR